MCLFWSFYSRVWSKWLFTFYSSPLGIRFLRHHPKHANQFRTEDRQSPGKDRSTTTRPTPNPCDITDNIKACIMTNLWWLEQKQNSTGEISLPIQLYFVIINGSKLQEPNMQASIFHLTIVLTAKFLASVHGYPSGAPMSACSSFTPQHPGTSPSTAPFPYTITTDTASYEPGGKVTSKTAFFTVFFLYVFICLHIYVYILYICISIYLSIN